MRNLIASPSPRYLKEVLDLRREIPCDQLFVKRYFEGPAYRAIREFYITHDEEYDGYLVIAPDDLIVTRRDYSILNQDVNLANSNIPVISGLCNINLTNLRDTFAASTFQNLEYVQLGYLKEEDILREGFTNENPFMQVSWTGFPLTFIRRDVVEKVSFEGRPGGRVENEGCAFDLQFAIELQKLGIPQYVDCRVRMKHLSGYGWNDIKNLGKEGFEPYSEFFPYFSVPPPPLL